MSEGTGEFERTYADHIDNACLECGEPWVREDWACGEPSTYYCPNGHSWITRTETDPETTRANSERLKRSSSLPASEEGR